MQQQPLLVLTKAVMYFWQGNKDMSTKRKPLQTYSVWGYEIPAANPGVLMVLASVLIGPLVWLAAGWWASNYDKRLMYAGIAWILFFPVFFHVRNRAVRKEVEQGLHDPLYGPHLRRMRQREFDKSGAKKFLIGLYVCAFALVAAIVGLRFSLGIDVLRSLGIPAVAQHAAVNIAVPTPAAK